MTVVAWTLHNTSMGVAQATLFNFSTIAGSFVLQVTPSSPPLVIAPAASWGYLTLTFPGCAVSMPFIGPQGMPHGLQPLSWSGWVSGPIVATQRVMYALVMDKTNGPRVFVNGMEYVRPDLGTLGNPVCRVGFGSTWGSPQGTLSFSTQRSRILFQQYEVYNLALDVSVLGNMFANQGVVAPPPLTGSAAAGPFLDCRAADTANAFMNHRYLGGAPMENNRVADLVGSNDGVLSESLLVNPTAGTLSTTFLPPDLTFIPALFPNGTLSFGQMDVSPESTGATVRILSAWGGPAGTLTLQHVGYTVTVSPTNITIVNPRLGNPFSTAYSLVLPGAGFNNQYVTFLASGTAASVFIGDSRVAATPTLGVAMQNNTYTAATAVLFSAPLNIYDIQYYNYALEASNVIGLAAGQPC